MFEENRFLLEKFGSELIRMDVKAEIELCIPIRIYGVAPKRSMNHAQNYCGTLIQNSIVDPIVQKFLNFMIKIKFRISGFESRLQMDSCARELDGVRRNGATGGG
jgi:hypothetical protein